jgi:benzoate/toluate 1,2-dioxygenase alpha subunit
MQHLSRAGEVALARHRRKVSELSEFQTIPPGYSFDQFSLGLTAAEARCSSRQREANMARAKTPRRKQMRDTIRQTLDSAVEDIAKEGTYRVAREIFTDPDIFELEMKHIFEGNWIYLAHESQIPNKNDYFTSYMGRQPIFIARDRDGELNAFINACSHRGAMLCRFKRGSRVIFTCPFHGWTFTNSGKLLKVKNPEGAGYPECFDKEGSHDLTKVARFESYRGFLFGSLNPDVVPLIEHLGEAAKIIDLIVDQSPEGLEVLRGASTYVYDGNWKLQTENGADGYHVSSVHWNYAVTTSRRKQAEKPDGIRAMDAGSWAKQGGGFYSFENGHLLLWTNCGLDGAALTQSLPLPERVPDGPVQLADPPVSADRRR